MKIDVKVPAEGGIELGAWLCLPKGDGIRPAITMAHGFGGTKEHGLERFALAFAAAGFVVLVHDHRNFGTSGGDLRGDIDPWQQIADWRRAISYLESRAEVDPTRIGLWGTSYAGGHALVLGATDRRLRCIVSQVPTISGYEQDITIRSTRAARMYEPGNWITRVSPTPLLLVVARDDRLTAADLALAAYERALEPKRLALIPGGHFDPYLGQFPLAEAAANEWFHEHLLNPN